ncbi:MAG: hypothetical protein FD137_1919 [Spirochaetes bacterium]|nr:MAG: hypothetical protein FD137_1919 [Spirochaetota bacterium]
MKKTLIVIAIAFVVIGVASAQPWSQSPWNTQPGRGNAPFHGRGYHQAPAAPLSALEKVTLEGKLELVSGRVAIKKEANTYFVMIPNRLYGFVDGLKEGASVKVEGLSRAIPGLENSFGVKVESIELIGRKIDLSQTALQRGGPMGGMMGGPFCGCMGTTNSRKLGMGRMGR